MSESKPILWHIPISHYSEKARWALAHKRVEHERRAPVPGAHLVIALWLTRGRHPTFPVLRLDERNIGDSTAIVAALEERRPEAALYPEDPNERRRALELEDFFDEELGPQIRLLVWHEVRSDRELMERLSADLMPGKLGDTAASRAIGARFGAAWVQVRFRVADVEAAATARRQVVAALDRLEAELDASGSGYLVGGAFTVADLTAASLFYPMVIPPEGPQVLPEAPPALEEFFAPLREREGGRWVSEMFARHRRPAAHAAA